ncbi:MAG: SpoIIE family protein phosphatase [Leptospiraceae bacterium]|nr:SpoIIE family protein phosphatase [Leptospiraceae bacterium]MCZ8345001.1 SpoIIE family protein phosphatase [Leptospiraceae bacterium]
MIKKYSILSDLSLRTKMIVLVSLVVLISVLPLSAIVLYRNQAVVLDKTFEVCRNLAENISNLSTEELLINETYDATQTSLNRLKQSKISGLLDSFVLNIDGKFVADLNNEKIGDEASDEMIDDYSSLTELTLKEISLENNSILRFIFPIFIEYKNQKMRVGTAVFDFDKNKVYEPVFQIRQTVIIVASVLFTVGIVLALLAAFSLSKPLEKLSEGARLIGQGDLNYRFPISSKDEIGNLAITFNQMTSQIQDFTNNLELMVEKRTDELNESLRVVQELKEAQDGDYFLTSLLLDPLQMNNNTSSNIKTEFFIEQKKKFTFKKWESEIGGDICITDTIQLFGKDYTVFINGDAMGKSIQGAGGALVFGVVFNTGITRSKLEKNSNVHPELWLRERYLDIQNVFLSFDGSMYISISMGLIDNETGLMYYINAEHPWSILYRDGKASFLEQELFLRKIGTPGQENKFYIKLFQMQEDDIILFGSDGRDDILLQSDDLNEEIMNEDEFLFIKTVEEAKAEVEDIIKLTKIKGKISDDFSLLRIEYKKPTSSDTVFDDTIFNLIDELQSKKISEPKYVIDKINSIVYEYRDQKILFKIRAEAYINIQDYQEALTDYLHYSTLDPSDSLVLFEISKLYETIGDINNAANFGERVYLRLPNFLENIKHLITLNFKLGNDDKAKILSDKTLSLTKQDSISKQKKAIADVSNFFEKENEVRKLEGLSEEEKIKIANSYYRKGDYQNAMKLYQECYKNNNQNTWVCFRLANSFSLLNKNKKALEFYQKVLDIEPDNFHAINNMGSIYYKLGDYNKSRELWTSLTNSHPEFTKAQLNLSHLEKLEQQSITSNGMDNQV